MTAELWLEKRCVHGLIGCAEMICDHQPGKHPKDEYGLYSECVCSGGSWVRLDPDKVVFTIPNDMWGTDDEYTVQDVIDALLEEENRAALDELSRFSEELELYEDELSGDCETDCQEACAYPGQFTECEL